MATAYARLVNWGFARLYHEFAWGYDAIAALVSGGHWRDWALAVQPYLAGRLLELGCGTGDLQRTLARHPALLPAAGLDRSPQMLAIARRKLARAGVPLRLVRGCAEALPFPFASFDTLVATFPSEYIVAPQTLAEARRVLRPGGRLVIALAARFTGDGFYQRLVDLAYRASLQRSPLAAPPPRSPLATLLEQAGFVAHEYHEPAPGGVVHLVIGTAP